MQQIRAGRPDGSMLNHIQVEAYGGQQLLPSWSGRLTGASFCGDQARCVRVRASALLKKQCHTPCFQNMQAGFVWHVTVIGLLRFNPQWFVRWGRTKLVYDQCSANFSAKAFRF